MCPDLLRSYGTANWCFVRNPIWHLSTTIFAINHFAFFAASRESPGLNPSQEEFSKMRSLLLVAHGSRREASNEEIRDLTTALAGQARDRFGRVSCAFLEIAEPSIPDGIEEEVRAGASEVVVLPYFLSAGRHVAEDIPGEVRSKQAEHPGIRIRIAPYLGLAEALPGILLDLSGS